MQQQRGGTVRGDCDRYIHVHVNVVPRYQIIATESVSGSLELDAYACMQCNESARAEQPTGTYLS